MQSGGRWAGQEGRAVDEMGRGREGEEGEEERRGRSSTCISTYRPYTRHATTQYLNYFIASLRGAK